MQKLTTVTVNANSSYIFEQSDPSIHKFVWSYEITISNDSNEIVQLLHRYWRITDMSGKVEEIHGAGVVGLQPLIKPGKKFIYTSYCQLMTPQGTMEGYYELQNIDEKRYSVDIPRFALLAPAAITDPYRTNLH